MFSTLVVKTPKGVTYETPMAMVLSPGIDNNKLVEGEIERQVPDDVLDSISDSNDLDNMLRLTWEGRTGPEYLNLWKMALEYRNHGKSTEAEHYLEQAWTGLRHIAGVSHDDTNKVAYSLASLYADTGHVDKAVALVERIIQGHVKTLGYESKVTQQRVVQAAAILNSWHRNAEALGLLARAKELRDMLDAVDGRSPGKRPKKVNNGRRAKGKKTVEAIVDKPEDEVSLLLADGFATFDSAKIDWSLSVARRQMSTRSDSAELLLLAIIKHCEMHPNTNLRQHLVARGELLGLYQKLDIAKQHVAAFQSAMHALRQIWSGIGWDADDDIDYLEIMESSLQLIANILKGGYVHEAQLLFEEAAEVAARVFEYADERTVWTFITIGLVFQTYRGWNEAWGWFERALSAAYNTFGGMNSKDGVVKSLQAALKRKHFSYLTDKAQPFKVIFGISGITIRPGRIHLE